MKAKVVRDRERRFEAERRRNMLPVQCAEPGCPNRTRYAGRCPDHTRGGGWVGAGRDYGSAWPKIRTAHLHLEPECRVCGRPAVTLDHIRPRAEGGTHDDANLQSLCAIHAHEKNIRDAHAGRKRKRR
jgi:5-methylcytosine-specific restriction protein A